MPTLPTELAAFSYLLDAQPAHMRDCFSYYLCLLMAQAGKTHLVEKVPGENGTLCVFETTVGDRSGVAVAGAVSWLWLFWRANRG